MLSRVFFDALATSQSMRTIAARYGLRRQHGFARRYVAGETAADAVSVAREVEAAAMTQTLGYLGVPVATMAEADAATRACIGVLNEVAAAGIGRNLSLKLTHVGLTVDRATCVDNLRRILDPAAAQDFFVRLEMEDSAYTQLTLDIFETLWQQGYRNAGVVLQAYLPRSLDDARRMNALGARVRLVKGAYAESKRIAHRSRPRIDRAFIDIIELLLTDGAYPAIATHDTALIEATNTFAATHGIARDRYEFQMLYGVRRDLQSALASEGYRVRVYIPFGGDWFGYVMRRLGERPSDVGWVLRNIMFGR